ncbi:hypothetical protein J4E91_010052 [Alternaria rosae]|nr:hypothetical protein J4E91_010052 [Alternaria rosae]
MTSETPTIPTLHSKAEYLKAVMYEGVTILEGTATWCKNCHIVAPEVAKMVAEYPNVKFYTYDVEECEDIAQELGVRSMPTFSVFKDGDIMEGVTGAKPKEVRKAIEGLHLKKHGIPSISISELVQAASTESKAWEDLIAPTLTYRHLQTDYDRLKQELREHKRKRREIQNGPIEVSGATVYDHGSEKLKNDIAIQTEKILQCISEVSELSRKAYIATVAANRAAKSNIEVPGVGTWSPLPATPTTATTAPIPPPITTTTSLLSTDVTVTTAQVKVTHVTSDVVVAAKDVFGNAASDVATPVLTSKTALVKVDEKLSKIILCPQQKQYSNVKRIEPDVLSIGDIAWFPVLRPTLFASPSDIHTEFGYICAKSYPIIIVEKLDDCMIGLIISTSGGNGLNRKGTSIKSRSVPIIHESYSNLTSSEWGTDVYPKRLLRVDRNGEYSPPSGAYVDLLNTITIPYDSRYKKEGSIVAADALPLQQMRLSAFLATTGAGRSGSYVEFRNWLDKRGSQFGIAPGLTEMVDKAKAEARAQGLAQAQAEIKAKMETQVKREEKARMKAKSWEEMKAHTEAKDRRYDRARIDAQIRADIQAEAEAKIKAKVRSEAKELEEAKVREEAKKREQAKEYEEAKQFHDTKEQEKLTQAKAICTRMSAIGREDA